MGSSRVSAVAAHVADELDERAIESTREWWTKYLKGEADFRGVKMADIRVVATRTNTSFGLDDCSVTELFDITDHLLSQPATEDKLCATLLLAEHHLDRLETSDVERLAGPLERDELADWNSCDWYCVKLLGPFIAEREAEHRGKAIAAWRDRPGLWQRRAAAVAFVNLVSKAPLFDEMHELVVGVCERNVEDPTRWSQTSVGWVLRELSRQNPAIVESFLARHGDRMSTEARKAAGKHLDP